MDAVLEPLSFPTESMEEVTKETFRSYDCVLCDTAFDFEMKDELFKHLLSTHKLVIADVQLVADLGCYLHYWKNRFRQDELTKFCTVIQTNSNESDIGERENYYLLCDSLQEDKDIREKLQKDKLVQVLEQLQLERVDKNFSQSCLFCKHHTFSDKVECLNHMKQEHSFNIGLPDNIVFVNEFINTLREKLEKLQCLYCERTFKDKMVLKEHMRKKGHKKINNKNTFYDKFYVVNYLEFGKNWEVVQKEDDAHCTEDAECSDAEWSDWQDKIAGKAICLFCDKTFESGDEILSHLKVEHLLDWCEIKTRLNLSFYQQIKLVNFIRRQVHQNRCVYCDLRHDTRISLYTHMMEKHHFGKIPDIPIWDQPQYYFPTYENDNLLCMISSMDQETSEENPVFAEDPPDILISESILESLCSDGDAGVAEPLQFSAH